MKQRHRFPQFGMALVWMLFMLTSVQTASADPPPVASSGSYILFRDVEASAGDISSTSYKMTGIAGEPSVSNTVTSGSYKLRPGYNFSVSVYIPEIGLKQGTTDIASGGSYDFGAVTVSSSSGAVTFTIENTGSAALTLTGSSDKIAISGSSDFTVDQSGVTSPVSASGTTDFTVTFTPSSDGAKSAIVTISSDDSDEGSYTFTLNGTGTTAPPAGSPPTDITLSDITVAENQPAGTVVGSLSATDPDGGPHTFYLVVHPELGWGENVYFQIEGTNLKTAATFDYETKNTYTVYIRANDSNGYPCFKTFVINVGDVNESPTGLVLSYRWTDEKLPAGSRIGEFTALGDPDAGETFAYSLISGDGSDDNAAFSLEGNVLKTAGGFDYNVKNTYRIRAKASDKGGLSVESAFVISVNDLNEAPTDITLSKSSIDENQPVSAVVGTFSGTDPNPGDTLTFSLLPGEGNTYFYIYDGNILKIRQAFDYETRKAYEISVLADDGNGGTYRKDFTITVNDVNDAPEISAIEDTEIGGFGNAGSAIADFTVSDPDTPAEKLTVSGKSSDPKLLPQTGIVFSGTGTDRRLTLTPVSGKSGSATVTVTVSDGELTAETAFTLTVTILPAPVFDDISVKPTTPDSAVVPGGTLSFTAVIPNTGNADAAGTVFTLPIPENTAYAPDSVMIRFADTETGKTADLPGVSLPEYDGTENRLVWKGDISAGLQAEIVFDVIADTDLQTGDVIDADG